MKEKYSNIIVEFYEKMSSWENSVVADRDISLPQMHLLEVVGNNKLIRMNKLSQILGVTTGTLTVMVHRLIDKKYIKKVIDQDDKRSYFIVLTDKGLIEYENHHNMHEHLIQEIIDSIGSDKSKIFFDQLNIIQELI